MNIIPKNDEICVSDEQNVEVTANFPRRFDILTEKEEMVKYLKENGYAVVKDVADQEQILSAKNKFWEWATSLSPSLNRYDPSTWDGKNWVGNERNGICHYINHSEFAWNTRLLPKVKETFSAIWNDSDLIVSFDAGNAYRPWKYNEKWMTSGGWWHVDQNGTTGNHKEGMVCVQGLVTYYDATEETGGLCLIPKSHLQFSDVCKRASSAKLGIDYVTLLKREEPLLNKGYLICAKAGDLILWDSRTIHCNTPCISKGNSVLSNENNKDQVELIRLVSYVCMSPFKSASEKIIESRKKGFLLKNPTSHWPNKEITTWVVTDENSFKITECSKEMLSLVGFRENRSRCIMF